jgi:hypothetical protein
MALGNNEKTLCNKLVSDFDKLIQPGKSAKGAINSATNAMKSKLSGMVFSDPTDLNNGLSAFQNSLKDALPGDQLSDLNKIKDFINGCDYLKDLNPVSAVIGAIGGIFDTVDNLIGGLDLTLPEFSAGGLGSLVDKLLDGIPGIPGGDKIADLLAKADTLLNCLSNSCAAVDPSYISDLSQKSAELQDTYDALGLIDDPNDPNYGKFDYSTMYNDLGMSTSEINAINSVKSGINSGKDAGTEAVANSVQAMKNAVKGGLF